MRTGWRFDWERDDGIGKDEDVTEMGWRMEKGQGREWAGTEQERRVGRKTGLKWEWKMRGGVSIEEWMGKGRQYICYAAFAVLIKIGLKCGLKCG